MFGAIGDGVVDDSKSIQSALDWVSSSSYRKIIFSSDKKYRTSKTLYADFKNTYKGNIIQMDGPLYPDVSVSDALVITNSTYSEFSF